MNSGIGNLEIGKMCELTLDYMLVNTDTSICNEVIPSSASTLEELVSQFDFHRSWDWIMYAFEFIEGLDLDAEGAIHRTAVQNAILTADKNKSFFSISNFALWYNIKESVANG